MIFIDDYIKDPQYSIVGVSINDTDKEIEIYVSERNMAQNSIPKVLNGYTVIILKTYAG